MQGGMALNGALVGRALRVILTDVQIELKRELLQVPRECHSVRVGLAEM